MPGAASPMHRLVADCRTRLAAGDAATLRDQVDVTEIAAPTGHEAARADWMAARFRALGLADVRIDEAGNAIGRRPGLDSSGMLVVCAHLDTVFPADTPLRVRRDGGRLSGPGIGDNGRGLAALLALARALDGVHLRPPRDIAFVATTGEEGSGDLRGAKHYFASAPDVTAAIALDGPGDERIVHRALGSRRYRVEFNGPGGHSWAAFGAPNAVHAAGRAIARLAALSLPHAPRTTLSVTRLSGGLSINSIPADAWFEVDLRSTAPAMLDRYDRELHQLARAAMDAENDRRVEGSGPLSVAVTRIGDRPCGEVPDDHPLVRAAIEATRAAGREPELAAASTDANVPISLGIPAVSLGAGGRGGDAHTPHEWYENADGPLGVARAMALLLAPPA